MVFITGSVKGGKLFCYASVKEPFNAFSLVHNLDKTATFWLEKTEEVLHLLSQQDNFRANINVALKLMVNALNADKAFLFEVTPNTKKEEEVFFTRALEVPCVGLAKENNIPKEIVGVSIPVERSKKWFETAASEVKLHSACDLPNWKVIPIDLENKAVAKLVFEHPILGKAVKDIGQNIRSIMVICLYQQGAIYGYLFLYSTQKISVSKEALLFVSSCGRLLSSSLHLQQARSKKIMHPSGVSQQKNDTSLLALELELPHEAYSDLASLISSAIPNHIFVVDIKNRRLLYTNADSFLGYNFKEEQKPLILFSSIIHPDDQEKVIATFISKLRRAKDRDIVQNEYRVQHSQGHWVWLQERAKVFRRDEEGQLSQYITILQDVTEKKETLFRISESEQRYRNLVRYSTEGIFYMNCSKPIPIDLPVEEQLKRYYDQAFIQECNLPLAKMYGYEDVEALRYQKLKDFHEKGSYRYNQMSFRQFIEQGYSIEGTETIEALTDGSRKFFVNKRFGIIENNCLIGVWGVQRDITAKYNAEKALQASETKLSVLVKDIKLGIWEWLIAEKMLVLNEDSFLMLGPNRSNLSFNDFYRLIHPEDRRLLLQLIKRYVKGEIRQLQSDVRYLNENKKWRWIRFNGSLVARNRLSGTVIDIHKEKEDELRIKQADELRKAILNTLPDTKLRLNKQGEILDVYSSTKAEAHTILKQPENVGKTLSDLLPSFLAKGLVYNIKKAIDTSSLQTFEFVDPCSVDEVFYYEARINRINTNEAILILRNITALKIIEKKLNNQIDKYDLEKRRLEKYIASNLQLENFAYIASHDLREPLRTMRTFGQLLHKKAYQNLDEDSQSYLDFIINSSERMNQLIEDLLTYSRVNSSPLTREPIDVKLLLKEVLGHLQSRIEETQALIHIQSLPPVVYGSLTALKQLFQNLLSNAIKFHRPNVAPQIEISHEETPTHWQFRVKDNGIGISSEFHDKVFAIFKTLHSHQAYEGTGIGLALVKSIVTQHGGEVWIGEEQTEGSCFYFTILKETQKNATLKA